MQNRRISSIMCVQASHRGGGTMKSIYTYYKERLIEISGKNRSLYIRSFGKKTGYDLGRIFSADPARAEEFFDFLWSGGRDKYTVISPEIASLKKILTPEDAAERKTARAKQPFAAALEKEASAVAVLRREAEDIEKETGRYELFVGYPFVCGGIRDMSIKAPLLFFPVEAEITERNTVCLSLKRNESVRLNQALVFAYAQAKNLNIDEMETDFAGLRASGFAGIDAVLSYLAKFGIRMRMSDKKTVVPFDALPEPDPKDALEVKRAVVLARYSLANSIYNDYSELERSHMTNAAIEELFEPHKTRRRKPKPGKDRNCYCISDLDYAQHKVVEKVAASGNMVIYGPPGTGKSQTIVNLISDALCKGKRVLVVSQKKAALDVVYNRLGDLNEKAMFIVDPVKERGDFYARCLARHEEAMKKRTGDYSAEYADTAEKLARETAKLKEISDTFDADNGFGISLMDMYYGSFIPGKKSGENAIYSAMLKDKELLSMDYPSMRAAIDSLLEHDKTEIYYNFVENKKVNPFIQHLKPDLPIDTLAWARNKFTELTGAKRAVFDEADYPFARQIIAHYDKLADKRNEKAFIRMLAGFEYPSAEKFLRVSRVLFFMYPFAKIRMIRKEREIKRLYEQTKDAIAEFVGDYEFLREVLTYEGYAMALGGIFEGNENTLSNLKAALADYVKVSDLSVSLRNFSRAEKHILAFAYKITDNYERFRNVIVKLLPLRVYHEIINCEKSKKEELSATVDFENIKARINTLTGKLAGISRRICADSFIPEYKEMYENNANAKDYLYQITKKQNFWPIRRAMEVFGDYLLTLYPCWLLSPENVSSILPLKKNLFDLVLFDEASQVFIENTVPAIIRGKNVVVSGDAKQLRPTTTFMRRYMGGADDDGDLTMQAALEVESLLDLAVARLGNANITYHYRSRSRGLIDFSNKAFYEGLLHISPDINRSLRNRAIERISVKGTWQDRRNVQEAAETVKLLKKLFKGRANDTVGIITFGIEQQACIEDAIEKECIKDSDFRTAYIKAANRKEDGSDVGLFIKNIENVQGDERDIIIFSIGYAKGEGDRVASHFGALSVEGGENRLNVAVTRAKKKIYVITSIEPEDLRVEGSKNSGPKLFKAYLTYARAVSAGNKAEINAVLNALCPPSGTVRHAELTVPVEQQIASKLRSMGYETDTDLGSGTNKISVAVYDRKHDRYVLGIQVDKVLYSANETPLERDVYACRFLEQKGWNIMRVWSRDWWHNSHDVIERIRRRIEAVMTQPLSK